MYPAVETIKVTPRKLQKSRVIAVPRFGSREHLASAKTTRAREFILLEATRRARHRVAEWGRPHEKFYLAESTVADWLNLRRDLTRVPEGFVVAMVITKGEGEKVHRFLWLAALGEMEFVPLLDQYSSENEDRFDELWSAWRNGDPGVTYDSFLAGELA